MLVRAWFTALREFFAGDGPGAAAAIAFYVLFSSFPMLIFLVSVSGILLKNQHLQQELIEGVVQLIPAAGDRETNLVVQAFRGVSKSAGISSALGFVITAWSGTGMFRAIRRAVDRAYEAPVSRSFILRHVIDLVMIFAVGLFFIISLSATALLQSAPRIGALFPALKQLPLLNAILGASGVLWKQLSFLIPLALSTIAFFFLYWLVPASTRPRASLWAGAITAALLFETAKIGFVFYLSRFNRYDLIFGPLGTVVAFLGWIYLIAMILLYGAEVAAAFTPRGKKRGSRSSRG